MYVEKKVFEDKEFYYVDVGQESHGRPSYRLWVSSHFVAQDEYGRPYIQFPTVHADIVVTEKGNKVLKPTSGMNVFYIFQECGYRGDSSIEILSPHEKAFKFLIFSSPVGSLGASEGYLVATKESFVKYRWKRTGRLYGSPSKGITAIYVDGKVEELPVDDVSDIAKEL